MFGVVDDLVGLCVRAVCKVRGGAEKPAAGARSVAPCVHDYLLRQWGNENNS